MDSRLSNVTIKVDCVTLEGILCIPLNPIGIIVFSHGTGSSRISPSNLYVSKVLNSAGFATLLFDLLTPQEERLDSITGEFRSNLNFLSNRIISTTNWIKENPLLTGLPIGYYGASAGGGAAILSSHSSNNLIFGVVSRGGRPDLVGGLLKSITTPTLLIVGGDDCDTYSLNKSAIQQMNQCQDKELIVIPNASHLFPEPGCLEQVAEFSKQFLKNQLDNFIKQHSPTCGSSNGSGSSINNTFNNNSNSFLLGKSILVSNSTTVQLEFGID
ncbi:hypothetical protein PPL_02229 [Heterostelium album PN500]|uniref:Dienelactone hydrolase domain-containing protein n=1 Tax=Heterostelium pallidum (strain ATCC 26659 / Pp 5 / PN500) TaxID=670386 RepID=D3B1Q5_HETP5|nr:hypothetical protein PPL_02229 [Heterostelium album PN500]EFA85229.1 hypothetical protein PPL_02229 [Heterostelium album PN500]|eukprot:XP_020437338.1 hypothetical protein PPL_02229 [Heterostelium album PN500]